MRMHSRMILLGVVWLVLGGLLALGLHVRLAGIGRSTAEFTDRQLPLTLAVSSVRGQIMQAQATCHDLATDQEPAARAEHAQLLSKQLWEIETGLAKLSETIADPALKTAFAPVYDASASWHRSAREFATTQASLPASAESGAGLAEMSAKFVAAEHQLGAYTENELRPALEARAEITRTTVSSIRNEAFTLIGLAALAGCALTVFMARTVREQQRTAAAAQERQEFDARITDALGMVQSETEAMSLIEDIIERIHPDLPATVLVADSSRAHLHEAAATARAESCSPLCSVRTPSGCPAIRRGFEVTFRSSDEFDACPHLRKRASGACSATCVPITITGQHVGVLHAVTPDGAPLKHDEIARLSVIAAKAGERIGVIRAFSQSEDQATKDALTGLLNRRSAEDMVQQLQASNTTFCIVYADIDHFKRLNDTHGHETGDRVLRLFSRIMLDSLRPTDIVARWGGEEFVIMLPETDLELARPIVERLRQAIQDGTGSGTVPAVTASFGISDCDPKDDFAERLNDADAALLRAKQAGRNRITFAGLTGLAATA